MKNILKVLLAISIVFAIVYILGPKSKIQTLAGDYPEVPIDLDELEDYVQMQEDTVKGLKAGNEAKIIWADSLSKSKTTYSVVYIHGFGASEKEGDPVHREIAAHFGANLYLVRLPEHGIQRDNAFKYLSAQALVDEAREAFMIGKSLGDSVILVGTSMGGALSLIVASERADIKALVLYSPAIEAGNNALDQFFNPWAKYIAENFSFKDGVRRTSREGDKAKYWSEYYHVNGFESLAVLLKSKMNAETFQKIEMPLYMAYYYKNDQEQDFVVSVPKMKEMFQQINTPEHLKEAQAFPETGDHVIASSITSKDWKGVLEGTIKFLENKAKVKPKAFTVSENL